MWPGTVKAAERIYAGSVVAAGVVVLIAVLRFGGAIGPVFAGLPTAGPFTQWGLPLARFGFDLCGIACVGTLLAAAVLAPATSPESRACVRAAGLWALGWAVAAALSYLLTMSDFVPMPVLELLGTPDVLSFGLSIPQTQALALVLAAAVVVAVCTRLRAVPHQLTLAIAVLGLLPPAFVGHAASAGDPGLAISSLTVHVVAVSLWVGGLAAILVHFRRSDRLSVALPRFSALALCCFTAVAVSGVVGAWVRLSAPSDLWRTPYGLIVLAKATALTVLGGFGWSHRRRTVAGIADRGVRRTFVRLAAGELVVMAAAIGLAVGLSRTPPPPSIGDGMAAVAGAMERQRAGGP